MSVTAIFILIGVGYLVLVAGTVLLYARYRRRRADKSWQEWHRRQRGIVFAWRMVFGSLPVDRLTDQRVEAHSETGEGWPRRVL